MMDHNTNNTFRGFSGQSPRRHSPFTILQPTLVNCTSCLLVGIAVIVFLFCFTGDGECQSTQEDIHSTAIANAPAEQGGVLVRLSSIIEQQNRMYISITPRTSAKEIFYRLTPEADFRSSGFLQHFDPTSGTRLPNNMFLTNIVPTLLVQVKYIGTDDNEYGPFDIELDIAKEALNNVKNQLLAEHIPWVEFRVADLVEKRLSVFTSIFATHGSTYAVEKIFYGINTKKPNIEREPLGTSDSNNRNGDLGEVDGDKTDFVSVQIFFKDGTRSDVRIYEVDHSSRDDEAEGEPERVSVP